MRSITLCALLLFAAGAAAAEEAADAEILLLGTFHFANPGLDYVKGDVPDVLTEER
ncbi:MAG TPA: hypothetical protein VM779_11690 [Thermoanaerobaculia bacterium]|nr:hypothetical protein [Thermoanaerobaculia bacterium]